MFENSQLVRGAMAGAVATVPMTMAMTRLREELPEWQRQQPLPPVEITARAENRVGVNWDQETHKAAAVVAHFGYGALCGALYGLLAKRFHQREEVKAPVFALGVWAISYLGWLPALRLMPNAKNLPRERNTMMILSHIVWGLALSRFIKQEPKKIIREAMKGASGGQKSAKLARRVLG